MGATFKDFKSMLYTDEETMSKVALLKKRLQSLLCSTLSLGWNCCKKVTLLTLLD